MKFNVLQETDANINIMPGDSLSVYYDDEELLREEIKEKMHVDKVVIFDFEHAMGMKKGIGGAFGKKE
jgi:hypothetical protein